MTTKTKDVVLDKDLPEEIAPEQVWDVINFARQLSQYAGIMTPDTINARMKDVNMNPLSATEKAIEEALKNPKNSEEQLRGFSEYFEYTNMLYKRTLKYLSNMLSFDYTYVCKNAYTEEEYRSKAYQKDEKILNDFLDKFDVKSEFKRVMGQVMRHDVFYSSLRDDGEKYILQELPMKYCKLTGRWDYGLLFDFNMMWFINQPGVDINMYPPVFKKYYKRVMDAKDNGYKVSGSVNQRNGEWVYWVQTRPEDNMWAWKFDPDQAGQVPFLAPMFSDLVMTPMIRNLQKNKYIIQASRLMVGLIPLLKDNKSGNVKDMLAISPEVAGKFASLMRAGIPDAINMAIAPFEDVKQYSFEGDNFNLLEDHNKNVGATSGINSRLIYGLERPNVEETRNSIAVDEYLLNTIYSQFANFLNYHINKRTKKYKFEFTFEGTEFPISRERRLEDALKLADKGIVLPQKISAAMGIQPKDFERHMMQARAMGWVDKLTPIVSAYQMSGSDSESKSGRPKQSVSDLSESGVNTRESGANTTRGGDE